MCLFNHINISIFAIRAGVFMRFYAYHVTSVNPPPPPRVKKNITYSILCHYFECHMRSPSKHCNLNRKNKTKIHFVPKSSDIVEYERKYSR